MHRPCTSAVVAEVVKPVRRAAQLRPLLTYALPVVAVQTLVELGPRVSRVRRSGRCQCRARPGRPHPAAASRPRHTPEDRRSTAGESGRDPQRADRRIIADRGGAQARPAASDAFVHARDRRSTSSVPQHSPVRVGLALPETRGVVAERRGSPGRRSRPACVAEGPDGARGPMRAVSGGSRLVSACRRSRRRVRLASRAA